MLSAFTEEFCGLHLHFIHLLFYWHWLGIEETCAKIRLPVKILTKEGNGYWLQGTGFGIPRGVPCPAPDLPAPLQISLPHCRCSCPTADMPAPLQVSCPPADLPGPLLAALGASAVQSGASGWSRLAVGVWCSLQSTCYDHSWAISAARSSRSGSDHAELGLNHSSVPLCLFADPSTKVKPRGFRRGLYLH